MELTIELTDTCLNDCIHCSSMAGEHLHHCLSLNRIHDVVDEIKPDKVILSGGEPLLYPFLDELLTSIHTKCTIGLDSCGFVKASNIPSEISLVSDAYISYFFHEHNEEITQREFSLSRNSINPLSLIGFLKRTTNVSVWINTIMFDERQIIDIPRVCYDLRVPVHIIKLLHRGRARNLTILPIDEQRHLALEVLDQLNPTLALQRPPSFLCRHLSEVLPDDIDILSSIYNKSKMSHSLTLSECRCSEKRTLLVDGTLIGCVASKNITTDLDVPRICDR